MIPRLIETLIGLSTGTVLVWRQDSKRWQIKNVRDFSHWIGHEELAYTHWLPLPDAPSINKEKSDE